MREFPDQATLNFLVGLRVANIVLQPYSIDVRFDDNTLLVVEHAIEHIDDNENRQILDIQGGYGATALHKIVDKQVTSIVRTPFELTLQFDNEHRIKVISRPCQYESGHIWREQDLFVF